VLCGPVPLRANVCLDFAKENSTRSLVQHLAPSHVMRGRPLSPTSLPTLNTEPKQLPYHQFTIQVCSSSCICIGALCPSAPAFAGPLLPSQPWIGSTLSSSSSLLCPLIASTVAAVLGRFLCPGVVALAVSTYYFFWLMSHRVE
jgi:hypothetical protein